MMGLALVVGNACAFQIHKSQSMRQIATCLYSSPDSTAERLLLERFKRRRQHLDMVIQQEREHRAPNPDLTMEQVVEETLNGLRNPHSPAHNFGFSALLLASTPSWRDFLYTSVGAPLSYSVQKVAISLEAAMSRPNNQFRILVGQEDAPYKIVFPTDALDYEDGTAWLECRLRSEDDDELLVVLGWSLVQDQDGAWCIDGFDWQDFRDAYRPGIGREEWERICG